MHFTFSESALKDLKKLSKTQARRLETKLLYWQKIADPLVFAKALTKHQVVTHRFRLGTYRVLVKVNGDELRILRIRARKDVYK